MKIAEYLVKTHRITDIIKIFTLEFGGEPVTNETLEILAEFLVMRHY